MTAPNALGEFLRTRRARLAPPDLGLPEFGLRRVPGLRREEVAAIAGLSPSYYTRLEQGVARAPSASVVDALASALRLDAVEHTYLRCLASPPGRGARTWPEAAVTCPSIKGLVQALPIPAVALAKSLDILAWNALGRALIGPASPCRRDGDGEEGLGNFAALMLLAPRSRRRFPEVDEEARYLAGHLRLQSAQHPGDSSLHAIIDQLNDACPAFARHWRDHVVEELRPFTNRIRHELVGELSLRRQVFRAAGNPDEQLVLYHAQPGTPDESALELLAGLCGETTPRGEVPAVVEPGLVPAGFSSRA